MQFLQSAMIVRQNLQPFDVDITAEFVGKYSARNVVVVIFLAKMLDAKVIHGFIKTSKGHKYVF